MNFAGSATLRRSLVIGLVAALSAMLLGAPTAAVGERERYPVNYNFLENAVTYGNRDSAPGSNIWSCTPSKRHPRPVVLVHGTAGSAAGNWGTLSAVLANRGYCVFALTYGEAEELSGTPVRVGGMGDMRESARELGSFVQKVRRATGSREVDLVGHSQGSLMPGWYLAFLGGHRYVRRHVSLAGVWQGLGNNGSQALYTMAAAYGLDPTSLVPVFKAGTQFSRSSPFMTRLHRRGLAVDGVRYTNIVTRYDQVVFPYTRGVADGMRNIVVQDRCSLDFSDHVQLPSSPNAIRLVLNALDPRRAQPVDCQLVLPVNGFVTRPGPDGVSGP